MRSPAARFILGAVALLALGAAAYYVNQIEHQVTAARVADRAFDVSVREAADGLADLRVSQLAYVAAGTDVESWMPRVKETVADVAKTLTALRSEATSGATSTALGKAGDLMTEFASVDQRAREYLQSGQPLMASDVIFTEGNQGAADAAQQLSLARTAEHQAFETAEAGLRRQQAAVLGAGAAVVVLVVALLVLIGPRRKELGEPIETGSLGIAHAASPAAPDFPAADPNTAKDLREARVSSPYVTARPAGPVLRAASQLCTDLGRVSDLDELKRLVGQAADLMDASGIVIWISGSDRTYVQPALSHGYPPQVVARMSRILRSADNAAAAAYRTGQMQIVLAHPGESNGAVVAPLLSADGCIGALSAEIRGGGESSESVQALAGIFAAQLAGVLNTSSASAHEQRNVATGTI
jgi:hypothetical protein